MQNLNENNPLWRSLPFSQPYEIYGLGISQIQDKNGETICEITPHMHWVVKNIIDKRPSLMNEISVNTLRAYVNCEIIFNEKAKIKERDLREILSRPDVDYY